MAGRPRAAILTKPARGPSIFLARRVNNPQRHTPGGGKRVA